MGGGGGVPDLVKKIVCRQENLEKNCLHNNFKEKKLIAQKVKRKKIVFKTVLERDFNMMYYMNLECML